MISNEAHFVDIIILNNNYISIYNLIQNDYHN